MSNPLETIIIDLPFLVAASNTDVGKVRSHNEDNFLLKSWPDQQAILAVVADGMGGHAGGEIASEIAINTFAELLENPLPVDLHDRYELFLKTFHRADQNIQAESLKNFPFMNNLGTTVVAAIITPTELIHFYVGDSRLYHFRAGANTDANTYANTYENTYVTKDHSMIQVLLDLGRITVDDIANHPMRSVIYSSLGCRQNNSLTIAPAIPSEASDDHSVSPKRSLQSGDLILLSSDGLHGAIAPEELDNLVREKGNQPADLVNDGINLANNHGGHDNITIIGVRIK